MNQLRYSSAEDESSMIPCLLAKSFNNCWPECAIQNVLFKRPVARGKKYGGCTKPGNFITGYEPPSRGWMEKNPHRKELPCREVKLLIEILSKCEQGRIQSAQRGGDTGFKSTVIWSTEIYPAVGPGFFACSRSTRLIPHAIVIIRNRPPIHVLRHRRGLNRPLDNDPIQAKYI